MSRAGKVSIVVIVLGVLAIGAFFLLFPRLAAWAIRSRVLPKVEERLDRQLTVEDIKVGYGRATLAGIGMYGPADAERAPLARVPKIEISFDFWKLLTGKVIIYEVVVDGPRLELTRDATGKDNYSDVAVRLRARRSDGAPSVTGGRTIRPEIVRVQGGWLSLVDEQHGLRAGIDGIEVLSPRGGRITASLTGLHADHRLGPRVSVRALEVEADPADLRATLIVKLDGGSAVVTPHLSLTGINGRIAADKVPGYARIELRGGYGGAAETLWHAEGSVDLDRREGDIHVRAERFTLDKIEHVLAATPLQSPAATSVDAALDLTFREQVLSFAGNLDVQGLTVYHPWLALDPLRDLRLRTQVKGTYATRARLLTLDELAVSFRGLDARLEGSAALVGGEDEPGIPRTERRVRARVVVPSVPCQQVLNAMPVELVPRLRGFTLKGNFAADVKLEIDWAHLDDLVLDGSVGIFGCKVLKSPDDMKQERLEGEFEHVVEVEENNFISFRVGPSNPDFVPIADVSPYVLKSLMTTEDSGFLKHKGFITREFRSALVKDLKEGYFKYGASSITMQLVKNVLLDRQKTLSRKLQELFLTWYIETILPKERLFEIYVNVIEFGPGLYGIGPAARHYFGKHPRDINPVEAAFFSSILPSPKKRYMQYCEGELNRWSDAKVQRILKLMHEREHITLEEYTAAVATPLAFDRTEALPEAECKKMTQRMIENARPTQPRKGG